MGRAARVRDRLLLPVHAVRTAAALGGLVVVVLGGVAVGLVTGSRRRGMNLAARFAPPGCLRLAGIRLRVTGAEHLDSPRPAIFTFNHQSALDVAVLGALIRHDITAVAKKEAARDPVFAPIGWLIRAAYVDRGNPTQTRGALEPVLALLREGTSLAIAPEGTRAHGPALGPFKKGAFHIALQSGVPIVPIVIHDLGAVLDPRTHLIRPGVLQVDVLPPVRPTDWTADSLSARADHLRRRYLETLDAG